jgi:hypothetical protein
VCVRSMGIHYIMKVVCIHSVRSEALLLFLLFQQPFIHIVLGVSIQIRANIVMFFINSIYNIKPLVMFIRRVSVSFDHHQ